MSHASTDPRKRKQAMADDHIGWSAAERAEIANHASNCSWTYIDRSEVPPGRSEVRLIWVYKRKRIVAPSRPDSAYRVAHRCTAWTTTRPSAPPFARRRYAL
eukprot:5367884-Pleurochrysis_carterae.AAC.1